MSSDNLFPLVPWGTKTCQEVKWAGLLRSVAQSSGVLGIQHPPHCFGAAVVSERGPCRPQRADTGIVGAPRFQRERFVGAYAQFS